MTQSQLDRAVARATGEDARTIRQLGFGLADPEVVQYDPDGDDRPPLILDWDEVENVFSEGRLVGHRDPTMRYGRNS